MISYIFTRPALVGDFGFIKCYFLIITAVFAIDMRVVIFDVRLE